MEVVHPLKVDRGLISVVVPNLGDVDVDLERVFQLFDQVAIVWVIAALVSCPDQSRLGPERDHLLEDVVSLDVVLESLV